jgi:hypothetical protein
MSTPAHRVKPHWGDVAVVDVKTSAIRAWVSKMVTDEVGAATIENAFGLLRQVMGAALEDNRIARNTDRRVEAVDHHAS